MKAPEQVYALLVEANPIPDADSLPTVDRQLRVVDSRRPTMQTEDRIHTERPSPRRRSLIPALAAVAIVVVAVIALIVITDGSDDPGDAAAQPQEPIATEAQSSPDIGREQSALAATEQFYLALADGDLVAVESLTGSDPADLRMWAFNSALVAEFPREVRECRVVDAANQLFVSVECTVSITDPYFTASGLTEWVEPWRVVDDGPLEWRPIDADLATGLRAARDYLIANHPDDYDEMCNPSSYTPFGSVHFNAGIALTAECADLLVAHGITIGEWIEAGQP